MSADRLADKWTPPNGTVANFFRKLAVSKPEKVTFYDLPGCGHVPFDDSPEEAREGSALPLSVAAASTFCASQLQVTTFAPQP